MNFEELKASLLSSVKDLQTTVRQVGKAAVNQVSVNSHTKLQLLEQQVIYEMEQHLNLVDGSISQSLQEILRILVNDDGQCTETFVESEFLHQIVVLSAKGSPVGYREVVLKFAAHFVELLEAKLLFHQTIHQAISTLIEETKDHSIIKLEYNLAVKIIKNPELLELFYDRHSRKNEFKVFDNLIQYVHMDGEPGALSRAAFELLISECDRLELSDYLIEADFSRYLISSLCGLYTQLPEILPELLTLPSTTMRAMTRTFDVDHNNFMILYMFIQRCVRVCNSNALLKPVFEEFKYFFLDQVVSESLYSCSDFDGSTSTTLYYLLHMVDRSDDQRLLKLIAEFLLLDNDSDGDDQELIPRDILLSKLTSLSDRIRVQTSQLLVSLLSKYPETVYLLVENLPRNSEVSDIVLSVEMIKMYQTLLPIGTDNTYSSLDSYVVDACSNILSLKDSYVAPTTTLEDEEDTESELDEIALMVEEIRANPIINKMLTMLENLFSQSLAVNIAVTGLITALITQPNHILFNAMIQQSEDPTHRTLYSVCQKLLEKSHEVKKSIPSYEWRHSLVRDQLMIEQYPDDVLGVSKDDTDAIRNVILVEEFLKEIIACLMMRGGSNMNFVDFDEEAREE